MAAQKSIVMVSVDCLRADHTGFMGYERPTTPTLDALVSESHVLPVAIVAGAPTYYSLPAMLASRYPLSLGRDVLGIAPDEPTLASVLKRAGYTTAAFSAGNPYISAHFGYEQGFDVFHDFLQVTPETASTDVPRVGWASKLNRELQRVRPAMGPFGVIYDELYFQYCQRVTPAPKSLELLRQYPSADVIVRDACSWLGSVGDQPFFLWLHFMDPHWPYYPKEEALAMMGDEAVAPVRGRYLNSFWNRADLSTRGLARYRDKVVTLYDAGIRWVDFQLLRLIDALRKSGRWEDCVLAVTADHGEEFLDHGGRFHAPSHLTEELIHVPLMLRVPGARKVETSNAPFSMIHLAPTLLDIVDKPSPAEFQGASYWPGLRDGSGWDSVAISECVAGCTNPFHAENRSGSRVLSVRDSRFKLLLKFDPPEERLYDLEADPKEQKPLGVGDQKHARRRLLEVALQHLAESVSRRDQDVRLRARLRDLRLEWARSAP